MSIIAVTSSRTSPGATTLAAGLAIAWSHQCERSLLIEADPSGGVLSLRFDLAPSPGLSTFGSDIRNGYMHELVWSNTQDMRGVHCMPAPVDPRLARSWSERIAPDLVENLQSLGAPAVIDLGWVDQDGESLALAQAADTTLVVTTGHAAEVQALLFQVRQLRNVGANVALVVIGDRPNNPQEIAALAGVPLAAVLPDDGANAAALSGQAFSPKKFQRSLLWRTMSGLAVSLLDEERMRLRSQPETDDVAQPAAASADAVSVIPPRPTYTPEPLNDADSVMPPPPVGAPIDAAVAPPAPVEAPPVPLALVDPLPPEPTVQMPRELLLSSGERHMVSMHAPITIGRHSSCDVVIADREVSRHHGTLTFTEHGWTYTDNGSRNGSFVNGQRCTQSLLTVRDELVLGQTRLELSTARIATSA